MSEPTPPGEPQDPTAYPPPSAPPPAAPPPPSAPPPSGGGYSAGPPISGNVAPAGYANSDEKTWALLAHFGGIVLGFIAPLIAMLVKGNESPTVRAHSVEALNFQITWGVIAVVGWILGFCGSFIVIGAIFFIVPFIAWLVIVIFSILAGVKANEGVLYKYPMTYRIIT